MDRTGQSDAAPPGDAAPERRSRAEAVRPAAAVRGYRLVDGVRVFRGGAGEIRFRRGVWNFTEAVLNFAGQPEAVADFFAVVADALVTDGAVDPDAVARASATEPRALEAYLDVLENLVQRQFLRRAEDDAGAGLVSALFGGSASSYAEASGQARPVAFFADTDYAATAARTIGVEAGLPMDILGQELFDDLAAADLTTRTEAVEHSRDLHRLRRRLDGYFAVVGCIAQPNLTVLRNLNRVLVAAEKPLILGLVDGPFVTILSTFARESGCFECYEQRMMARLEDTVAYRDFVRRTAHASGPPDAGALAPSMHLLTAAVMAEGILYSRLGMLRLAGRALSVYLPLLEIQAQDILRVPYCPACGYIATAQMDEMYRSSNRLVSEMLSGITLTPDAP